MASETIGSQLDTLRRRKLTELASIQRVSGSEVLRRLIDGAHEALLGSRPVVALRPPKDEETIG
jgi:hypothetical protein